MHLILLCYLKWRGRGRQEGERKRGKEGGREGRERERGAGRMDGGREGGKSEQLHYQNGYTIILSKQRSLSNGVITRESE